MSDERIDAAINSYALAELPPDFVGKTMRRVAANARPHMQPSFVDVAVPLFFSASAGILVTAVWLLYWQLAPLVFEDLRQSILLFNWSLSPGVFMALAVAGAVLCGAIGGLLMIWVWLAGEPKIQPLKL